MSGKEIIMKEFIDALDDSRVWWMDQKENRVYYICGLLDMTLGMLRKLEDEDEEGA